MKKLLGMLVVLLALLLAIGAGAEECAHDSFYSKWQPYDETTHQYVCADCGSVLETAQHSNMCTEDLTVCEWCHATGIVCMVMHPYASLEYVDLGSQHQQICTACGDAFDEAEDHTTLCTAPSDVCTGCDLSGISLENMRLIHNIWVQYDSYVDDVYTCDYCGAYACGEYDNSIAFPHFASCETPDTCKYCKKTGLDIKEDNISHGESEFVDLGVNHEERCAHCGYVLLNEPHSAVCSAPDTCVGCGMTGVEMPEVEHGCAIYFDRDGMCVGQCPICDEIVEETQHQRLCTDETETCVICGSIDVSCEVSHLYSEETVYVNCGEVCQAICGSCQQVSWEGQHWRLCTDEPDTCSLCGAVDVSCTVYHPYDFVMVNDGTRHHQECSGCGEVFWSQEHYVLCIAEFPTICWVCHLEIGEDALPIRQHIYQYEDLGETHLVTCEYCDLNEESPHTAACTNPTLCTECNADNVTVAEEQIQHDWNGSTTTYTEETHSFLCKDCQETITRPHAFDANNLCQECYYVYYTKLPGDADNNGKFTIDDAVAVLQKLANDSLYINEPNADVNADGTVDTADLLLLMQYAAGWDVTIR